VSPQKQVGPHLQASDVIRPLPHLVLRPKLDAHRMYAQEQFVIYTTRIIAYQNNECLKRVFYYNNIFLLQNTNLTL
jgi:hypothetical protein